MATLAPDGRINEAMMDAEIARLTALWTGGDENRAEAVLASMLGDRLDAIDRFDRAQLADVIHVCRASRSASEAGRTLFSVSRLSKSSANDADRLRKYLARFGTTFDKERIAARRR